MNLRSKLLTSGMLAAGLVLFAGAAMAASAQGGSSDRGGSVSAGGRDSGPDRGSNNADGRDFGIGEEPGTTSSSKLSGDGWAGGPCANSGNEGCSNSIPNGSGGSGGGSGGGGSSGGGGGHEDDDENAGGTGGGAGGGPDQVPSPTTEAPGVGSFTAASDPTVAPVPPSFGWKPQAPKPAPSTAQ